MIVGIAWKGGGILVLPIILIPLLICMAFTSNLVIPDNPPYPHLWPQGLSLLVSAVILFLLNRHLRQGPQHKPRPTIGGEYAKHARKQTIEAENAKARSTSRFSAENDTGWFMFIPTGVWPFIIVAVGIFLIVGDVVESAAKRAKPDITHPAK